MQPYKGYFISTSVLPVHPFSPDWYIGGSVLVPGRGSSIVEVTRFQLERFTVSIKEMAEWFGLKAYRTPFTFSYRIIRLRIFRVGSQY